MNLNKMFVFIFVFLITFSALLGTMCTGFKILGIDADVQDKESANFFSSMNVTQYNYTLSLNITYGEEEQYDFGLPEGQKLEFWWNYETHFGTRMLELRHLMDSFWGWWYNWHWLTIPSPYLEQTPLGTGLGLDKDGVLALFDDDFNASYCEFTCEHVHVKLFILTANQSWTLSESWDNEKLKLYTSYGIDWDETGTSMWGIMGELLTFQNPELGIPGPGGYILNLGFSGALWACIAILFFALITSVIPFIGGWGGGGD